MHITNNHVERNFKTLSAKQLFKLEPKEITPTGFEGNPYTGINTDIPLKKAANYLNILYRDTNPDDAAPADMDASKRSTLVLPMLDRDKPTPKAYLFTGFISNADCRRWYRNKFKQPDDTPGAEQEPQDEPETEPETTTEGESE